MSKKEVSCNESESLKGTTPDNAMSVREAFVNDFIRGRVVNQCWDGIKSDVALFTRGQNVKDLTPTNMHALQVAWGAGDDLY